MRILRWLLLALIGTAITLSTLYVYFIHISGPNEPEISGELLSQTMEFDGRQRSYHLYLPKKLSSNPALILVMHGSMSKGLHMRGITAYGFETLAEEEGFIVVYPDGFERHWNDCRASAKYSANTLDINDVGFLSELVLQLQGEYGVDSSKIFATGLSNGGHMSYRLALEAPELVRAIAPMAASMPEDTNLGCRKSGTPMNVAIFNGTEDPVNPYHGGVVEILGDRSRGAVLSSQATMEYWLSLLSGAHAERVNEQVEQPLVVTRKQLPEVDGDPVTTIDVQIWKGKYQVRLYTMRGSGHVVPSRFVRYGAFFGGAAGDVEAADVVWSFFMDVMSNNDVVLADEKVIVSQANL